MHPLKFEGHNVVIAEDQEEYTALPAYVADTPEVHVVTCWELSAREREIIKSLGSS